MRLALKFAGLHAIIIIVAAIATWPVPLERLPWLRTIDFVVFWRIADFARLAEQIVRQTSPRADLHQVALVGGTLYAVSFLLAGTMQWFALGWVVSKVNRAMFKKPTGTR
jgi:hypothetical protein